jgi:hypothetical protein
MFRAMSRPLVLAGVLVALLGGCGGAPIPMHSGYNSRTAEPWKKPKEGKADGDLNYKEYRRAKWYVVNLIHGGDLTVTLDVTPPGDDKFDLAVEVLDPRFNVIAKGDKEDDDAFELKKTKTLPALQPGAYLIHLYLEGRMDTCEYELAVAFAPGKTGDVGDPNDTFPQEVAYVPDLPVVPLQDDTPIVKEPGGRGGRGGKGGGGGGKGGAETGGKGGTTASKPPGTGGGGAPVAARITDVSVGAGGTTITFNRGLLDNVKEGSAGRVDGVKGGEFQGGAKSCSDHQCKATVSASADDVNRSGHVTVTP